VAGLKSLIALRGIVLKRSDPRNDIERKPLKFFSAWLAGVLLVRLFVNAFFIRRAAVVGIILNTEQSAGSLILHGLAACFLMTLFLLQAGGGPGGSAGRVLLTPITPVAGVAAELLTFFRSYYYALGLVFFIPVTISLSEFTHPPTAVIGSLFLFTTLSCLALGFRALWITAGVERSRGLAALLLLMALMYANPEYRIGEEEITVTTSYGIYGVSDIPFLCGSPGVIGIILSALSTAAACVFTFFCVYSARRFGYRRRTFFRGLSRKSWKLTPLRRDLLSIAAFPEGAAGPAVSVIGGVYLLFRNESGMLPLLIVSYAAPLPVFRIQVRLLDGRHRTAPRYIWSSCSLERLFLARVKAVALSSAILLLPIMPAALSAGVCTEWAVVLLFTILASSVLGLAVSLIWPEWSRLSFLSILVPGGVCITVFVIRNLIGGTTHRIIVFCIMTVLSLFLFMLLLQRARMLDEEEKDRVLLYAL